MLLDKTGSLQSDGTIYTISGNEPIPADTKAIEFMVARNLYYRFGSRSERSLESLSYETRKISRAQKSYPLVIKTDSLIDRNFRHIFETTFPTIEEEHEFIDEKLSLYLNGIAEGNSIICSFGTSLDTRLEKAYARFSSCTLDLPEDLISEKELKLSPKKKIIVHSSGGSTLANENNYIYITNPIFFLEPKAEDFNMDDIYFYLAWLKSSFFLWYCSIILENINLFQLLINRQDSKLPILKNPEKEFKFKIISIVKNIILEENKFLKEIQKAIARKESKSDQEKLVNKHNKDTERFCKQIDMEFFSYLGLTKEEAKYIYKTLSYLNIYDYSIETAEDLNVLGENSHSFY